MNNEKIESCQIPKFSFPVQRPNFSLGLTSISDHAKNLIIKQYTRCVSYYGKNNVRYTKTCKPHLSKIFITDTKQSYYPEWQIDLKILEKKYKGIFLENQNSILKLQFDMDYCNQCKEKIYNTKLICNSCGNIAHPPKKLWSHSYLCSECGKTLCKQCTHYVRKWLILKRKLCRECGLTFESNSAKVKKLLK